MRQTRVLVTHGVTYLPKADQIVVMKDGRISEVGTYQELIQNDGAFADFITTYLTEEPANEEDEEGRLTSWKKTEKRSAFTI